MNFINLTPHDINVETESGIRVIPRSGIVARVKQEIVPCVEYDGIQISTAIYGEVENLPEEKDWHFYIVSKMVKDSLAVNNPSREDVVSPGELVRNEKGEVVACKNFIW